MLSSFSAVLQIWDSSIIFITSFYGYSRTHEAFSIGVSGLSDSCVLQMVSTQSVSVLVILFDVENEWLEWNFKWRPVWVGSMYNDVIRLKSTTLKQIYFALLVLYGLYFEFSYLHSKQIIQFLSFLLLNVKQFHCKAWSVFKYWVIYLLLKTFSVEYSSVISCVDITLTCHQRNIVN